MKTRTKGRAVDMSIPQAFIANLVQSMRHRCVALINARGGFTRY